MKTAIFSALCALVIGGAFVWGALNRPEPRLYAIEEGTKQHFNAQGQPVGAPRPFRRELHHRYRIILSLP